MTFRNTLLAAVAIASSASAHIIMESPVPYSVDSIDSAPISASQFPCKNQLGYKVSQVNKMAVGQQQPLKFKGTAVHNGGLCQLSVALTREPTKDTPFKVIKTIEGGCPGLDSKASEFSFALPAEIPDGDHTFAWTWMPVSSGGPEYYMNCAPIEVTGGASDDSKFNQLPDMLIANLKPLTDCEQQANTILQAPNPGNNVEKADNTGREVAPPKGNCGAPSGGGSPAPPVERRSSASIPVSSPTQAPAPANPGGIFAPGASSASADAPQSTETTLVTVTASSAAPTGTGAPVASPVVPTGTAAPVAPPAVPTGTGGAPAQPQPAPTGAPSNGGASCSPDGAIVCNGETQFGLCNHGSVVWQDVAAGTTCKNGAIQKREYNGRIVRRSV